MNNVLKLNPISSLAQKTLGTNYSITDDCKTPQAILVRSAVMQDFETPASLLCVARAGAGVNNIPFDDYAKKGIIVFNTPGANANAVKELVVATLIMSSRNLLAGAKWAQKLQGDDVKKQVEKGKSQFAGTEITGKTIGILGLGAIGRKVAHATNALGMKVIGYDPYVCEEAKALDFVTILDSMEEVFENADYITIHMPYSKATHHVINSESIDKMKDGVTIINAARGELVSTADIKLALESKKVNFYVTDFPDCDCLKCDGIIALPHLGASSFEAEENCAEMAALQIKLFIEEGIIRNAVNMPWLYVEKNKAHRASVIYEGETPIHANAKVTNNQGISYAIIESDTPIDVEALAKVAGVIKVRSIY